MEADCEVRTPISTRSSGIPPCSQAPERVARVNKARCVQSEKAGSILRPRSRLSGGAFYLEPARFGRHQIGFAYRNRKPNDLFYRTSFRFVHPLHRPHRRTHADPLAVRSVRKGASRFPSRRFAQGMGKEPSLLGTSAFSGVVLHSFPKETQS